MSIAATALKSISVLGIITAGFASPVNADEYLKSYAVAGHGNVQVHVDDSAVTVTTSETNQVEFRVTYQESPTLKIGGRLHIDSHQDGDQVNLTVTISPGTSLGFTSRHIKTEVRMPKNADLQIESQDGSVDVSSINGKVSIRAADGSIRASQLSGKIDIQTSDGSLKLDELKGECRLRTSDGSIDATNLDGKFDVSSDDGYIRLGGRFDSLGIKSRDGAVVARVASGSVMSSSWSIHASDGSVELSLPTDFKAELDLSTSDGRITLGLPLTVQGNINKTRIHGTLNGGGPTLTVHADDGSIQLNGT
jgi:DUF4097 and DUF4098 domain-containing protein YvlB